MDHVYRDQTIYPPAYSTTDRRHTPQAMFGDDANHSDPDHTGARLTYLTYFFSV